MADATRLVCPECELVYRVRNYRPAKQYKCKKCGCSLRSMDTECAARHPVPGDAETGDSIPLHNDPYTNNAGARIADFESGIANENIAAMSSTRRILGSEKHGGAGARDSEMFSRLESQVSRLSGLVDSLTGKAGEPGVEGDPAALGTEADKLRGELNSLLGEVEGKLSELGQKFDGDISSFLSERAKEAGDLLLSRLEEHRAAIQARSNELADVPDGAGGQTVEIDVQDLSDRLVAGIKAGAAPIGSEGGASVDALARIAEELVREQSINSARLTALTEETKNALAAFSRLDEWRGDLPILVADEIGRTVEDRVVGPISGALARQAPAILSDMQDNKLLDIVSRSVREAQRPLLREILAGGRGGVPLWLFASILLPLLLILGYLFLPGEFGFGDDVSAAAIESMSDSVSRMDNDGVLLSADTDDRLRNVESVVLDIHAQALNHARNAAALEEEVRSLKASLAERDGLIKEYSDTLQRQVKRLRAYEMTLTRLGVSPESIEE